MRRSEFSRGLLCLLTAAGVLSWSAACLAGTVGRVDMDTLRTPIYSLQGDAFVRTNGDRFSNRPLYCNHTAAAVLAGDKPYLSFGSGDFVNGSFMVALVRGGKAKWFQDASDITSEYRPGRMNWIVKDAAWGSTTIQLEAVPIAQGAGMVARVKVTGALLGDQLVWASGGAVRLKQTFLNQKDVTTAGREAMLKQSFVPDDCRGNEVSVGNGSWTLRPPSGKTTPTTSGHCSAPGKIITADASNWKEPASLATHPAEKLPLVSGTIQLGDITEIYWSMKTVSGDTQPAESQPADEFAAGISRVKAIESQVIVDTPDPWLNAAVGAACSVTDAVFRGGVYTHAGMRWGVPLLGWRTIFGGTVFGWHENVKTDAKLAIATQITESDKTAAVADPAAFLSSQSPDSRLFGKGRVTFHQPNHYDMQSQFFDQIVHAWRWTGDADLEKLLKPALDLHLEYIKNCFDPAGLGIYESYANSWPTDDQWYNGGGTSEETAYAYRSQQAALLMAHRAGDTQSESRHAAALATIRRGFDDLLWIPSRGHPGAYREQGGLKRLHEDPWLYGIFCPIDAVLLAAEQSAQALHYTEWGLERIKLPYGGEQCWPSNWVPSIWSVREMWPGDNYQLALAYFQTGLADDGWSLLHGTFPMLMFFGPVPGDLGHPAGATDFNDCASMFCRTVVEGLFGYTPDYPNDIVKIAPEFPSDWDHASIKTPDVSIAYQRHGGTTSYQVALTKPGNLEMLLPVSTTAVQNVTDDGKPIKWEIVPGFGRSLAKVTIANAAAANVEVTCRDVQPVQAAVHLAGNTGDRIHLHADDGVVVDFHDPQGVLADAKVDGGEVLGTLTANAGEHMVFALAQVGDTRQWRQFKIHVTDVSSDKAAADKLVQAVPKDARWATVDMQPKLNGDIRTIYQQKYLSPRPETCSLRLATDGYSTWQMVLDPKNKPPSIDLENASSLLNKAGQVVTSEGVPFQWSTGQSNIAFTSRWDNWPKQVDVPVNKKGDAIYFLLCGTTNSMECRIANAELRMKYSDGTVEKLEIVPPVNFWTLCPFGHADYDYSRDAFCLPAVPPTTIQLGKNCRAIVLNWRLRPGATLESVTLETLSEQVVIGLMGATVMNPQVGQ